MKTATKKKPEVKDDRNAEMGKRLALLTQIQQLVTDLHSQAGVTVKPEYPFALVRVLDREQKRGMIILPEKQKKTIIEGIVLDTFRPFYRKVKGAQDEVETKSSFKPGDHILFPHYEGVPVPIDDYAGDFRLVPEIFGFYGPERNGAIATIEYEAEKTNEWLLKLILGIRPIPAEHAEKLVSTLMQQAEIFPHNRKSLTQSALRDAKE